LNTLRNRYHEHKPYKIIYVKCQMLPKIPLLPPYIARLTGPPHVPLCFCAYARHALWILIALRVACSSNASTNHLGNGHLHPCSDAFASMRNGNVMTKVSSIPCRSPSQHFLKPGHVDAFAATKISYPSCEPRFFFSATCMTPSARDARLSKGRGAPRGRRALGDREDKVRGAPRGPNHLAQFSRKIAPDGLGPWGPRAPRHSVQHTPQKKNEVPRPKNFNVRVYCSDCLVNCNFRACFNVSAAMSHSPLPTSTTALSSAPQRCRS
jgi:hypothetical protein